MAATDPFSFSDSRNRRPCGEVHSSPEKAHCIWKAIWECSYPLATTLSLELPLTLTQEVGMTNGFAV